MTAPGDAAAQERDAIGSCVSPEGRILEMVARGTSLSHVLDGLCRLVEEQAPGVLASVLLLDGDVLRHGGAPSLPKAYTNAIDGAVIGPTAGSCGTATYRAQQVIVSMGRVIPGIPSKQTRTRGLYQKSTERSRFGMARIVRYP